MNLQVSYPICEVPYWAPNINTDVEGNAKIDFYHADGLGNYRVVIKGINAAGELERKVYRYKVE